MKRWLVVMLMTCACAAVLAQDVKQRSADEVLELTRSLLGKYPSEVPERFGWEGYRVARVSPSAVNVAITYNDAAQQARVSAYAPVRTLKLQEQCESKPDYAGTTAGGAQVRISLSECVTVGLRHAVGPGMPVPKGEAVVPMTAAQYREIQAKGVAVVVLFMPGAGVNGPLSTLENGGRLPTFNLPMHVRSRDHILHGQIIGIAVFEPDHGRELIAWTLNNPPKP